MYLNALSLKNGLRIAFTTDLPFSVDKLVPGWNIVTDVTNGATISFIGEEVVHIGNQDLNKVKEEEKPNLTITKTKA